MDKFLNWKDFDVEHKNPSEEALRRWRSAVSIVKNPRRRFRMVADLDKRSEAEKKKLEIKVISDKDKSQATNMVACTAMARGFPTSRLSHN
ncbi:hypothetical protein WN943_027322 [Citrus x changshan-huyou]